MSKVASALLRIPAAVNSRCRVPAAVAARKPENG